MTGKCVPRYSHEEHTADVVIVAEGPDLEKALEEAARGVFEVITDTGKVECKIWKEIKVDGIDLENLLYRWIEELLFYFDAEGMVFSRFKVLEIKEENGEYYLTAKVCGEKYDPSRHEHRTIVKAMTYAQMSIKKNDCWKISFVVDI